MKTWLLLILSLTIVACGSKAPEPERQSPRTAQNRSDLALPLGDEAKALKMANAMLARGVVLPEKEAESCWARNKGESLRKACLLLWARTKSQNPRLETAIGTNANQPYGAVAAVLQEHWLNHADASALFTVLEALADGPVWLRARAITVWTEGRHSLPLSLAKELRVRLAAESSLSPADLEEAWKALGRLSSGSRESLLHDHCSLLLRGETWVRCWRFLSAVGAQLDRSVLAPFLEGKLRTDWLFFERNLPHVAAKLLQFQLR